eukprot:gene9904-10917_t
MSLYVYEPTNMQPSISIPKEILEDLCSRFLINIPEEERKDLVRMCFQVELAHWFYLDFYRQEDPSLPGCGLQKFMEIIFSEFQFLNKSNSDLQEIYTEWKKYKFQVPVFGAILLDESLENCVLVRGCHKRISWGFPKGKVNKDEKGHNCAIREVSEETGLDITNYIDSEEYLEKSFHDHQVRLYIVPAISSMTDFEPKTRGEIAEIKWFPIDALPVHKKDNTPRVKLGLSPNSFFMVQPFVKDLRKWISQKLQSIEQLQVFSNSTPAFRSYDSTLQFGQSRLLLESEEQFTKEREEKLRKKKEKVEKHYREIDSLLHPLRNDTPENENRLKYLLQLNEFSDLPSEWDDPPKFQKVKTEDQQPEAIRKLLRGNVQAFADGPQERRKLLGPGFSPPCKPVEETSGRVSPNSQSQRDKRDRKPKQPTEYSPVGDAMQLDPMLFGCTSHMREIIDTSDKGAPKMRIPGTFQKLDDKRSATRRNDNPTTTSEYQAVGSRKLHFPSDAWSAATATKPKIFGNGKSAFHSYNHQASAKYEFSFNAPGFTNFEFDKSALMATLPPATTF